MAEFSRRLEEGGGSRHVGAHHAGGVGVPANEFVSCETHDRVDVAGQLFDQRPVADIASDQRKPAVVAEVSEPLLSRGPAQRVQDGDRHLGIRPKPVADEG